ncbi:MAG: AbrB/MazE/SpoVT family DNA-binding domain-containing protein [Acidobacteria bacterium]|nr:AbrB/MazE/SpoVT family DNA-binding domain-containing protein [Acidobacteriota bacterium]
MSDTTTPVSVRFGAQGRLVVPSPLREALGFKSGDPLVVRVQEGRLVVESRESAVRRIQERFGFPGRNVVDELIADRRREARSEDEAS